MGMFMVAWAPLTQVTSPRIGIFLKPYIFFYGNRPSVHTKSVNPFSCRGDFTTKETHIKWNGLIHLPYLSRYSFLFSATLSLIPSLSRFYRLKPVCELTSLSCHMSRHTLNSHAFSLRHTETAFFYNRSPEWSGSRQNESWNKLRGFKSVWCKQGLTGDRICLGGPVVVTLSPVPLSVFGTYERRISFISGRYS